MSKHPILLVDDDRLSRQLLTRALQRDGMDAVDCGSAREALEMIEASLPALLVSDYEMPECNGAELCELIRKHESPGIANLPIILLTAHSGEEHEVECLKAGANDFVSKPVNTAILRARIDTHLRLHALRTQLQQQNAELELWRRTHEMDLEAAQITQEAILPSAHPKIAGWDTAWHYRPVIQVGGDMYDWIRTADDRWLFWIADVTGHGASAALLTTLCKLVFRNAAEKSSSPAEILRVANADFFSMLRGKSFMTAACLVVEPSTGRLTFSGAGHPPLLIVRSSGQVEALSSMGPPVGILPGQKCEEAAAELAPGEFALLYTDGLYSMHDETGERMTPKQVPGMLPPDARSAEDFLNDLLNEVARRSDDETLDDDLAVVALRRLPES